MLYRFVTLVVAITLGLGWATAASARGGENISHAGAEKICQYHGGVSGSGCVFCGKINCTVVTCNRDGGCNVLVHKYATRSVGGGRTAHGPRPVGVEGLRANGAYLRSTGLTNRNGPDMPDRPRAGTGSAVSAYRGAAARGGFHH